jgi:hypothetical protein
MTKSTGTQLTTEQQIQRLWDIHQIENLMAKHAWYHALLKNQEELDDLWVRTTPEPHFAQNQGYYVGMESLRHYYGEINLVMQRHALEALNRVHPDVEVVDANLGAGFFAVHPQTTQVIEVAGDGQTAKGIWYSPGAIGGPGLDGEVFVNWMWERYGVDFAKEDGEWKIWHMHTYTDLGIPIGVPWSNSSTSSMMGAGVGVDGPDGPGFEIPAPDREGVGYHEFSYRQVPQPLPRIPEPYWTFSETFSY